MISRCSMRHAAAEQLAIEPPANVNRAGVAEGQEVVNAANFLIDTESTHGGAAGLHPTR